MLRPTPQSVRVASYGLPAGEVGVALATLELSKLHYVACESARPAAIMLLPTVKLHSSKAEFRIQGPH